MNLLRKYYDKDSIGEGIPDEVLKAAKQYAESFLGLGEWNKNWDRGFSACYSCVYRGFIAGYRNASEKLKEKDEEISRLKAENERLRGEVETVIRWNESWPLRDILNELVQASEILLDKKNYDGHGWEEIRHAMNHAKVIVSHLTPSPTTKK